MKSILILFFILTGSFTIATAQERSYGMSNASSSEIKAGLLISKIRDSIKISDEQASQIRTAMSQYWDDLQSIQGHKKYDEKSVSLLEHRDKEFLKILQEETLYLEFQKKFKEVEASQRRGYGRR